MWGCVSTVCEERRWMRICGRCPLRIIWACTFRKVPTSVLAGCICIWNSCQGYEPHSWCFECHNTASVCVVHHVVCTLGFLIKSKVSFLYQWVRSIDWSLFICRSPQTVQQQLSKKEIEDLLRRGAYGAIMDEEDEGAKFCEEDIDQILQRRTKTITIESEGRGSTFAKVNYRFSHWRHSRRGITGNLLCLTRCSPDDERPIWL